MRVGIPPHTHYQGALLTSGITLTEKSMVVIGLADRDQGLADRAVPRLAARRTDIIMVVTTDMCFNYLGRCEDNMPEFRFSL